ncbi:hypothetical protein Tco_0733995 [Tanacetum coccineum]
MDNPNITMEEYIRLEEEKARRHGKVYNWETAKYDMALLPRDQRHLWLRYRVEGYTEETVHDFEQRLEAIFGRQRSGSEVVPQVDLIQHFGRGQSSEKYLFRHTEGRESGFRLLGGYFIGHLAHHFGLGTERQPVVAAAALRGAEDAQDDDEGAQAVPAPIYAPPPPPPAAGRTMPQRLGDFSCMTQLMEASGRTYQAFDGTFRGSYPKVFERRTRRGTDGASTSTA